jgi:hypothetical protein
MIVRAAPWNTRVSGAARSTLLALALLLASARGLAQPAPIPPPEPPNGLPVVITLGSSELESPALEAALRRELGVPLSFDPLAKDRLEIVITGRRANVTYYRTEGDPVTRSVDLPRDRERALETIAFLAGNLARDEAAELLSLLAPATEATAEEPTPAPPEPPPAPPPPANERKPVPLARKPGELIEPNPFAWNLSLWHPTTLLADTERRRMSLEIGVAHSRLGALRGAALTLGYLRIDQPSEGYAAAILWNRSGPFKGIQTAIFVNEGHGPLTGISYADILNFRDGDITGAQGSLLYVQANAITGFQGGGLVAWSDGLRGAQLSGIGGYVGENASGVQISGTTAIARQDLDGVQIAGLLGYTRDLHGVAVDGLVSVARDVHGAQLSGLFSFARDVSGVQLAAVNVARRVKGVQIGVVNVADENDGGAIGLVNVSRNGKIQPSVWYSGPDTWLNTGVKLVSGYTYTLLGGGYDASGERVRYQATAGLHLPVERGHLEAGIGVARLHYARERLPLARQEARFESRVGWEVVRYLTPFVGGGFDYRLVGEGATFHGEFVAGVSVL